MLEKKMEIMLENSIKCLYNSFYLVRKDQKKTAFLIIKNVKAIHKNQNNK